MYEIYVLALMLGKSNIIHWWWECTLLQSLWKANLKYFNKREVYLSQGSAIWPLNVTKDSIFYYEIIVPTDLVLL